MARLSNTTREKMARALAHHRFAEVVAELTAESRALFRLVYETHHDAETRKHMTAIEKRNRSAFNRSDNLTANVTGQRIEVGRVMLGRQWRVEVEALPTLADTDRYNGIAIAADSDLAKRVLAFASANEKLADDRKIAEREALGALQQFSTGKKLAEEWPEAMPVIGALIPEDDRTLPVVQVGRLNDTFKLPPKTSLAARPVSS
jgi:hypothetical protein